MMNMLNHKCGRFVAAIVLMLAGCGSASSGWDGAFEGNVNGTPCTLTMVTADGQLLGTMDVDGYKYEIAGTVEVETASGSVFDPQAQGFMVMDATLNDGSIRMTMASQRTGMTVGQPVELLFERVGKRKAKQEEKTKRVSPDEIDRQVVGTWRSSESHTSGDFSMVAESKLVLLPGGTFVLGDGKVAGGGGVGGFSSGSSGQSVRGQWKTQNKQMFIRKEAAWVYFAKYSCNGQSLLLVFPDGSKQLLQRIR